MRKILIILSLILCGSVLFGQSPRIRLNQITKDSLTGSVVLSGSDSNMVYSRDFFLNLTDSVLILFGDTLSTTATAFTGVATDLTLTGNGTVGNELKVDTVIIATVSALADSLAGIISSVTTDLTLTGDGSIATPLKVDTSVIATIRALADSVATRGTVTSVAVAAGTGISISGSPITTSGTITVTNTAPNATHTGDVTGSSALTIANDAVTNAKMANMAQNTIKGRITASTGDPEDLTASQVRTILNVADGATANTGTVTSVSGTGTVNGISLSGTVTSSGNLTLGGTLSNVNLASQVTGTLPVANGGTGATTLTSGAFLKGNGTSAVSGSSNLTETADTVLIDKFLNVDTSTFYVDADSNRVGIGTTSPSGKLQVNDSLMVVDDTYNAVGINHVPIDANNTLVIKSSPTNASGDAGLKLFTPNTGSTNTDGFNFGIQNSTQDVYINQRENADLFFYVNGGNRLQIEPDGDVLMPDVYDTNTSGARDVQINSDGKLVATSSSINTKDIVGNYNKGIDWIKKLNPVYYTYKKDDRKLIQAGFIAEELDVLGLNEFVGYSLEGKADGINYAQLTTLTVKAIQEQQAIIETQQQEIETLKTQIQNILTEINNLKNN